MASSLATDDARRQRVAWLLTRAALVAVPALAFVAASFIRARARRRWMKRTAAELEAEPYAPARSQVMEQAQGVGGADETQSSSAPSAASVASVSRRCAQLLESDCTPIYITSHFLRLSDPTRYPPYHPRTHPDGYLSLAIAENKKVQQTFEPYLTHRPGMGVEETSYQNFSGMIHVRRAVAALLSRFIAGRYVNPDCLLMTAGANLALDSLFSCIADPEEYVLLATPFYAAFTWDLGLKSHVRIHKVETGPESSFHASVDDYRRALKEVRAMGRKVRAVLLCNPNNPLGTIESRAFLRELADWVRSEPDLHLVVDEVYALSVYGHLLPRKEGEDAADKSASAASLTPARSPFVSISNLLSAEEMGDRFHLVYAFSKDFGLSGFRCGLVYTENRAIQVAYNQLGQFNGISTDVQHFIYLMLTDEQMLLRHLSSMRADMANVVAAIHRRLHAAGIPFVPSQAGLFLWVDLRAWLAAPTPDAEIALYEQILEGANVNITPGTVFHCREPGFFRVCHSAASEQAVLAAWDRIIAFLQTKPRTTLA